MSNIKYEQITPITPRVLESDQLTVYIPTAGYETAAGISSYNKEHFIVTNGHVSLSTTPEKIIEQVLGKFSDDFTVGETVTLTREKRDAFSKPDLVMLDKADFEETTTDDNYTLYKFRRNNPLETPSLTQFNNTQFKYSDGLIQIDTDVIATVDDMVNTVNDAITPVANNIVQIKSELENKISGITKESLGLDQVENRKFSSYVYSEFGDSMQATFAEKFGAKLDETTWLTLFNDWKAKSSSISTPYTWLEYLDAERDSIWQTISAMGVFLGIFTDAAELETKYPANNAGTNKNATALVIETSTYWAIRRENGTYTWYDTGKEDISFYEAMETDGIAYKANGVSGSAGESGKWAQSDHVHPIDETRLSKSLYQRMNLAVTSTEPTDNDFIVDLWERDSAGNPVDNPSTNLKINIPYVRTSQYLHNWNGSEQVFTGPNNEYYWAGEVREFNDLDVDSIPNGALLIVDDGENVETGQSIGKNEIERKGINLDSASKDMFVITDYSEDMAGAPVTVKLVGEKYYVKPIDLGSVAGNMVVTKATDKGMTLAVQAFSSNHLISADELGKPTSTTIRHHNLVTTSRNDATVTLDTNRLLITESDNKVKAFDSGSVYNVLLASDGKGGIAKVTPSTLLGITAGNYPLVMEATGQVKTKNVDLNTVTTLTGHTGNKLLLSTNSQALTEFDTDEVENILLASDGNGGVKRLPLGENRFVYTDASGRLATISGTGYNGYYFGVGDNGLPTLVAPTIYSTLPVTTFASNPDSVQPSTVLVFADPGSDLRDGCLYFY